MQAHGGLLDSWKTSFKQLRGFLPGAGNSLDRYAAILEA